MFLHHLTKFINIISLLISIPSPPSWLAHSQLYPRTTFAPTNIPFNSHFLQFLRAGKSSLIKKNQLLKQKIKYACLCIPWRSCRVKSLERMCSIMFVAMITHVAKVVVETDGTFIPHTWDALTFAAIADNVWMLYSCTDKFTFCRIT